MSASRVKVVSLSIAVTEAVVLSVVFFTKLPTCTVDVKFCVLSTNLFDVVAEVVPLSSSSSFCSFELYILNKH